MKSFQSLIAVFVLCVSSIVGADDSSQTEPGVWFVEDHGGLASGWVGHESGAWMAIFCNEEGGGYIELVELPFEFERVGLVDVKPSEIGGIHHHWFAGRAGSKRVVAEIHAPIASTLRYIPTRWEVEDSNGNIHTIEFGTDGYDKARIELLYFCGLLYQGWTPNNEEKDR